MKGPMVIRCLLAALVLALTLPVASAQTPTPAQMEMLRQLPPDQQAQLLQQFRSQGGQPRVDPPLEMPAGEGQANGTARDEDRSQLPRQPIIDEATGLPLFGYDLFAGAPSTFAPVTDIPVPVDYVLGPGDQLHVQLLGKTPGVNVLVVNRDGAVNFPELGPIIVAGLSFDEARRMLQERVSQQMIGVTASITMGELRSIRIFVLGDAQRPGSYTVSSLSTITNALFASGGVKPIGLAADHPAEAQRRDWSRRWTCTTCCSGATRAPMRGSRRAT
jgi:polysaccharide biosynthesis/export protein